MGAAYFYHLTRHPLETALPQLLEKAMGAGWRIEVRCTDISRATWLDEKLWLGNENGFLPHGLAGGDHDHLQPVLISTQPIEDTHCIMAVDGADVSEEEVRSKERVCILFDGNDQDALLRARAQWKMLSDAQCHTQYWSEETGRWQKKAEANLPE
ncbi:MAG: DNA polymerase III subunit chi [Paracoccaceae bacterium]